MNTTLQTPAETRKAFNGLLKREQEMKKQSGNDTYYQIQETLNKEINAFLRTDFKALNTKQLLKLCSMVGKYRPLALHSFLIYCANLIND